MSLDIDEIEKILSLAKKYNVSDFEYAGFKFSLRPSYDIEESEDAAPPPKWEE